MSYLQTEPPPIVIHVILLIWSQSPYGSVIPITLLQPADFRRKATIFPAEDGTLIRKIPQIMVSQLPSPWDVFPPLFNQDILGDPQKTKCQKKVGIFIFFFFYVKCTMYVALAHVLINARLTRHFLLSLIRIEHAQLSCCWNKTQNFT